MSVLSTLATLFEGPAVDRLGWTLLHVVWQGAVVAAMAGLALVALRRRSANARYLAALAAFAVLAVCPPATFLLVSHGRGDLAGGAEMVPDRGPADGGSNAISADALVRRMAGSEPLDGVTMPANGMMLPGDEPWSMTLEEDDPAHRASDSDVTATRSQHQPPASDRLAPFLPWLVAAWFCGVIVLSLRLFVCWCGAERLKRRGTQPAGEEEASILEQLRQQMGIRRSIRLVRSSLVPVATAIGWLRPVVLLPADMLLGLTPRQLEAVLAHELAHIRRHDYLVNLLQSLVETLLFYHPAVWWLSHRIRVERENCCDDIAADVLGNRIAYAQILAHVAELGSRPHRLATAANSGELLPRIRRLLGLPPTHARNVPAWIVVVLLGSLVLAVGFLGSMAPESSAAPPSAANEPSQNVTETAADDLESLHSDPQMAQIIQSVIEQEEHYRDLETVVRNETFYDAEKSLAPTTVAKLHTIQQGDLFYFETEEITPQEYAEQERHRHAAAFDGEKTTSVEYGNSANIHLSRHEPPQMGPPHTWAISTFEVNFPLSTYLQGGPAVEKHPKIRQHPDSMGTSFEIYRIETEFVADEMAGGLNCKRVRVKRWNRREGDPVIQYLWLAPERNYLCVQAQWMTTINGAEVAAGDSGVAEFHQLAPGVWLPANVISVNYDFDSLRAGQPFPMVTRTLRLETAVAHPDHGVDRFDLELPEGTPVYTIDAERRVVDGPHHPQPAREHDETVTLEEIIERIRENERLYANIELVVHSTYQKDWIGNVSVDDNVAEFYSIIEQSRSISVNGRHYYHGETIRRTAEGPPVTEKLTSAFDGEWTRTVSRTSRDDSDKFEVKSASLIPTSDSRRVYQPHTMVSSDDDRRRLSAFLSSQWSNERLGYRHRVAYEGDDRIDGLFCHRLRREGIAGENDRISWSQYLWIARDRNYLPIRTEWRGSRWSENLPTGISTVEELREISPGLWLPFKWTSVSFKSSAGDGVSARQIILNWKREFHVQSATLNPEPEPHVFTTVHVPKGTEFSVRDEDGNSIGRHVQENDGNLSLTREQWLEMVSNAEEKAQARNAK